MEVRLDEAIGLVTESRSPSGAADRFAWDAFGRFVSVTNAAQEEVFRAEWTPLGIAASTDGRGVRLEWARDAFGRVLSVSEGVTNEIAAVSRDAAGRAVSASNAVARWTFSRDAVGRVAAASLDFAGGASHSLSFARDTTGAVTNAAFAPGFSVAREYDVDGNLVAVSDAAGRSWRIGHDAAGRRTAIVHPGGAVDSTAYDLCGRVSAWNAGGFSARSLSRNAAGECEEETVLAGPMPRPHSSLRLDLAFDAADRPTGSVARGVPGGAPQTLSFAHDGNGALASLSIGSEEAMSVAHDEFGLPRSVATGGGTREVFMRDAFGAVVRTERTAVPGAAPEVRLWVSDPTDPLHRPVLECDATGDVVRQYFWAEDRLLGFADADGALTLAHCDGQGSVVALSDAETGALLHRAAYGPFGDDWGHSGDNPTPFAWLGSWGVRSVAAQTAENQEQYQSQPGDSISTLNSQLSTLYLCGHRLYSPHLRRFLSPDPLGPAGGLNLYAYAEGDPLTFIDPLGLCGFKTQDSFWEYLISPEYWTDVGKVWNGYGDAVSTAASGTWQSIRHPLQTLENAGAFLATLATDPVGVAISARDAIAQSLSDPESFGSMFGGALITAATTLAPYTSSGSWNVGSKVYRVYGGNSSPFGKTWTPVDPRILRDYRNASGLPDSNSGRFLIEAVLENAKGVKVRDALPLDGNAGGLTELVIPHPGRQVQVLDLIGLNPEF